MRPILSACFCLAVLCDGVDAQQVVVNENIRLMPGFFTPSNFAIVASKCVVWDDCRESQPSIEFSYDGALLTFVLTSADEGLDMFVVQPGDVFSIATADAGLFPEVTDIDPPPPGGPAIVGTGDFYLGVRTGLGFTNGRPNRTAYGWAHIHPGNGDLTMIENVMSYNSSGIIVGTTTVVPEPSSSAMVIAALAILSVQLRIERRGRSNLSRRE